MNYENNVELVKAELIIAQNALFNAIDAVKEIQKTELDVLEYTGSGESPQYSNLHNVLTWLQSARKYIEKGGFQFNGYTYYEERESN
jgi:hypothetical protein